MPEDLPDVDYTTEAEYLDLLDMALLIAKLPVEELVRKRITGWGMWPHYVQMPMRVDAHAAFLMLTKQTQHSKEWAFAHGDELHNMVQACTSSVVQYARMTGGAPSTETITQCVHDQIDTMIRDTGRALFRHNSVTIYPVSPFIPVHLYGRSHLTWPQVHATRGAFAMALHPRLGADSPIACLGEDLVQYILEVAVFGSKATHQPRRDAAATRAQEIGRLSDAVWQMVLTA